MLSIWLSVISTLHKFPQPGVGQRVNNQKFQEPPHSRICQQSCQNLNFTQKWKVSLWKLQIIITSLTKFWESLDKKHFTYFILLSVCLQLAFRTGDVIPMYQLEVQLINWNHCVVSPCKLAKHSSQLTGIDHL